MALKILQIRNRLDLSRKAMDELVGKDAEFEQRYADLEAKIPEARDLEARAAIDGEIAAYDEELTAHNEAKENLRREIEELEAELAELDRPVEEEHIEKIPEERKENHPMEVRNTP